MYRKTVILLAFVVIPLFATGEETKGKAITLAEDNVIMDYNPANENTNLVRDKGEAPLWASDEQICSFSNNYKNNTYTLERRSNGDLYVCFYNNDYGRVELHRSTDDGESWSRIWEKSSRECPSMVLTDNYVCVTCARSFGSEYDIYVYKVSFSGSEVSNQIIDSSTEDDYYPYITTDAEQYNGNDIYLYVVWSRTIGSAEKDIWFCSLKESDLSFVINPKVIEGGGLTDWGDYLRARIDYEYYSSTDYLHLAFWDYDDDQIYYKRSTDFGNSWSSKTLRSEEGQHPDINAYDNKVFLVYHNDNVNEVRWSYSTSSGSSWSDDVDGLTSFDEYPRCHVSSGRWHISTYYENTLDWNYTTSTPSASATWYYNDVSDGTVPNLSALDQDIYASSNTDVALCWRGTNGAYFDASWRQNVQIPEANFSGTPRTGCASLTVAFTDLSTNNPISWLWDFGDGYTSTSQNPTHVYQNAGNYTVSLTASNSAGSDTETKTNYITVNGDPTANFTADKTSDCVPLTVNFTDQSTGNPTSWSWDFGDGGTSSSQNPSHTYNEAGTYTVSLTASNNCDSDTETKTNYITVGDEPVANFSGDPTSGCAPLTVDFTDESTNDPTSWSWDFGDGGTSSSQNPSHAYGNAGTYTVSLTSSNSCGSDTETKTDYITVNECDEPTAEFSGDPTSGCAPLTVDFTDESTGAPTSWAWEFGDGGSSTSQNPTHTYEETGTYTVSLTVSNDYGEDTETKEDYITVGEKPTANFSGNPTQGEVSLQVDFIDESTGDPSSWSWGFGDGGTSSSQNPTHTYGNAGTYTVFLTVSNDYGDDTETKPDYIVVYPTGVMEAEAIPSTFVLFQNIPNPVLSQTSIRYGLPQKATVILRIYDASGRVVCKLVDETKDAGYYTVNWDGRDDNRRRVASGVYLLKMICDDKFLGKKLMVVR